MNLELNLSLIKHLLIHFILAALSGLLCSYIFQGPLLLGLLSGIIGGFLIDLDHVLEYFIVFGLKFNISSFFKSHQFLKSDKIYLVFHALEYFPLIILLAYIFRFNALLSFVLITLAMSGLVHLLSDCVINNYPLKNYSIIYRASRNFSALKLLRAHQWENNLKMKRELGL